jgi:hypothetical protein
MEPIRRQTNSEMFPGGMMSEMRRIFIEKLGNPSHGSLQFTLLTLLQEKRQTVVFCPKCLVPVHASMVCVCESSTVFISANE